MATISPNNYQGTSYNPANQDPLPSAPHLPRKNRGSSKIARINSVLNGFFGDIKGISTFFLGVRSFDDAQKFISALSSRKVVWDSTQDWLDSAKGLGGHFKEITTLIGILEFRSFIFRDKNAVSKANPYEENTYWKTVETLQSLAQAALLTATGVSLFAKKNLMRDPKGAFASSIRPLSAIVFTATALIAARAYYNARSEEDVNGEKIKPTWVQTAKATYTVAVNAFRAAITISNPLAEAVPAVVTVGVNIFDGLYKFADRLVVSWNKPSAQTV